MQESSLSLTMTSVNPFTSVTLARSDPNFNHSPLSLTLSIRVFSPIYNNNDKLFLRLLKSQVIIVSCASVVVKYNQQTLSTSVVTDDVTQCELSITTSFCPCTSTATTYSLTVSGGLSNPSNGNAAASSSLVESKTYDNYLIDSSTYVISP